MTSGVGGGGGPIDPSLLPGTLEQPEAKSVSAEKAEGITVGDQGSKVASAAGTEVSTTPVGSDASSPTLKAANDSLVSRDPNATSSVLQEQFGGFFNVSDLDTQTALVGMLNGLVDSGVITEDKALALLGGVITMQEEAGGTTSLLDSTNPDLQTQADDAVRTYETLTPNEQKSYRFVGNFMAKIGEAKQLLAKIKLLISEHDSSEIMEKQASNIEDLTDKMEIATKAIQDRIDARKAMEEAKDKAGPFKELGKISKVLKDLNLAGGITVLIVAVVVLVVLVVLLGPMGIGPLMLIIPMLLGIILGSSLQVAAGAGAFDNNKDGLMAASMIGIFTSPLGLLGGPIGMMRGVKMGKVEKKQDKFRDREGAIGKLKGEEGVLTAEKSIASRALAPIQAALAESMELEEDKMEFMMGLRALMSVLQELIAKLEAGGVGGGGGEGAEYNAGQFQNPPPPDQAAANKVAEQMMTQLDQAISGLNELVTQFQVDPDKAMEGGQSVLDETFGVVLTTFNAVDFAASTGFDNPELKEAIMAGILDAMATTAEHYDAPDVLNSIFIDMEIIEKGETFEGHINSPENRDRILDGMLGNYQANDKFRQQMLDVFSSVAAPSSIDGSGGEGQGWQAQA